MVPTTHRRVPCLVQPSDFLLFATTTRAPLLLVGTGLNMLLQYDSPAEHLRLKSQPRTKHPGSKQAMAVQAPS